MRRRFRLTTWGTVVLAALACALIPSRASAQDDETGWYLLATGSLQQRQRSSEGAATYADFNAGFGAGSAIGYFVGPLAFEGEFSFLRNAADVVAFPSFGTGEGTGSATVQAYMGNLRFSFAPRGPFTPYIAAGFGGLKSGLHSLSNALGAAAGLAADGSNNGIVVAYQFRVGAGVRLTPRAQLLVGYRYLHGGELLYVDTAFGDLRPDGVRTHHLEATVRIGL